MKWIYCNNLRFDPVSCSKGGIFLKKQMMWFLLPIVLIPLLLFQPGKAVALSCAEISSVEDAYTTYDGIIVATVDSVRGSHADTNSVQLTVTKSFKGVQTDRLRIEENRSWGALNGPSKPKESYLFFLKQDNKGWENPLCAPTMKLADATQALVFLEQKGELPLQEAPAEAMGSSILIWLAIVVGVIVLAIFGWVRYRKRG